MSDEKPNSVTILLVDDDFQLRRTLGAVIECFGYDVVLASSGREAEEIAKNGQKIDLLLTDISLNTGFDGFELARRVRKTLPRLPVLYLSGVTDYSDAEIGALQAPILQKPIPPEELVQAISDALDG